MKVFKEATQSSKSWSIRLAEDGRILAVDSFTGNRLATILIFSEDGSVLKCMSVFSSLKGEGYDPYEHDNKFEDNGCIIIKDS